MAHTLTNAHVLSILGQPTFRHAVSSGALTANKAGLFDPSVVYALAATLVSTKRPEPTGRTKHQPYTLADLVKLKSKHLTPLEIQHVNGVSFVVCRCMCGVVKPIRLGGFVSGNIKTCGCRASSYGTRYGQLVSISADPADKRKTLCLCDCGNTTSVYKSALSSGSTKSCGCLRQSRRKHATT